MKAPKIPVSGIIRIRKPKPDPKKRAAEAINRPPVTETQSKKGRKDGDIKPPVKTERKTGKGAGKQLFVSGDPRGRPGPGRPPTPPEVKELLKANTVPSILFLAELVSIGREELAEARRRKEDVPGRR